MIPDEIHDKEGLHLAGLQSAPMDCRPSLRCALATFWLHSCSSSCPDAPETVFVHLRDTLKAETLSQNTSVLLPRA